MSFYNADGKILGTYISYRALDGEGKVISDAGLQPCFRTWMVYGAIPKESKSVVIYRPLNQIPYDPSAIMWFVMELDKMGFPLTYKMAGEVVEFVIPLEKYLKKLHVKATMTLTRCLWESGICRVADHFFSIREKEPELDPFIALQRAHKTSSYGLSTHAAICCGHGHPDVGKETFLKRLEASTRGVFDDGFASFSELNDLFL